MRTYIALSALLLVFSSACAGVDSQTKKSFKNTENTIALKDLTSRDYSMMGAGAQLESALEQKLSQSMFVLSHQNPKYLLKYKVVDYQEGNRITRFATLGISQAAHGKLRVKAALVEDGYTVGAWIIDAWIKGGITGGDPGTLFQQVADEIMAHLRGDF